MSGDSANECGLLYETPEWRRQPASVRRKEIAVREVDATIAVRPDSGIIKKKKKKKNFYVRTHLYGRERGHYCGTAEPVRYERKVRQRALYDRVEDMLRPGVAQRRPVLVQQVHQLFGYLSANRK